MSSGRGDTIQSGTAGSGVLQHQISQEDAPKRKGEQREVSEEEDKQVSRMSWKPSENSLSRGQGCRTAPHAVCGGYVWNEHRISFAEATVTLGRNISME